MHYCISCMHIACVLFALTLRRESSFVTEGAKFTASPLDGTLTARGPLLAPLAVSVAKKGGGSKASSPFWVEASFALSSETDPLFSSRRQVEWVAQGWSRCSRECGGGKQHVLLRSKNKSIFVNFSAILHFFLSFQVRGQI